MDQNMKSIQYSIYGISSYKTRGYYFFNGPLLKGQST
jgi:hypothetical protein